MHINRLFDLIPHQIATYDKKIALARKVAGVWKTYSSREFKTIVDNLSLALLANGIDKDDKVAIVSNNRPEWNFVDLALQQIGAISVPMYPTISAEDYQYIFGHAEVKMVFVGDSEIHAKAAEAAKDTDIRLISFDQLDGCEYWENFMKTGENGNLADLESRKNAVKSGDLVTIIYTSGTTGRPKGVMLTHGNIIHNLYAVEDRIVVPTGEGKALSFLPLCHIYMSELVHIVSFTWGFRYTMQKAWKQLEKTSKRYSHIFLIRCLDFWRRFMTRLCQKGYELTGVKKSLFFWALNLGLKYEPNKDQGAWYNFQLKLANKIIFSKWREALGGNVIQINSGASALQPRLARVFWSAGIPVCEGYGLTETSPVISASICNHKDIRIGMVGKIVKDVEVKIAPDGEILAKGPNIMQGYYKQPDLTAEVLEPEGWFHTGDIGELHEGGYLKITDRKKEMFKTSGGKYIAPQPMENKFKESSLIEQIIVVGENRNFPAALIVPSIQGLKDRCKHKDIPYTTDSEMLQKTEILEKFQREVEDRNKYFGKWEQVKKFKVLPNQWTIETGELTPTMKLKRKVIHQKYAKEIESLYA